MMHIVCLLETHPDRKKNVIEAIGNLTYKVKDDNGHEIENRVQVRELSLIDIVIQERALDEVLHKLNVPLAGQSDKLVNKVEKLKKYICTFGGLNKIKNVSGYDNLRPDFKNTEFWKQRKRGNWCKLMPLGTMKDEKNKEGLDRL
jgi:hypothetical protein